MLIIIKTNTSQCKKFDKLIKNLRKLSKLLKNVLLIFRNQQISKHIYIYIHVCELCCHVYWFNCRVITFPLYLFILIIFLYTELTNIFFPQGTICLT